VLPLVNGGTRGLNAFKELKLRDTSQAIPDVRHGTALPCLRCPLSLPEGL
jgi:hypothetical protein